MGPGNANLLNGAVQTARRGGEIGVPGMDELYFSWQWLDFHT